VTAVRRLRVWTLALLLALASLVALASPAGAQQPIDATEEGGEAFVAFTVMVVIFVFTLFMMDRIRKRRTDQDERTRD
jgi:hypothetical protein